MSRLPQSISSDSQPPSEPVVVTAEYPLICSNFGEQVVTTAGTSYSQLTVLVPQNRQLIMVPTYIPFMDNTTIAPVQFPIDGSNASISETVQQAAQSPLAGLAAGHGATPALNFQFSGGVPDGFNQGGRARSASQPRKRSRQAVSPATEFDFQGPTSYQQGESSTNAGSRPQRDYDDEPELIMPIKPKKTPNAFILYRRDRHKQRKKDRIEAKNVSTIAAQEWKALPDPVQQKYKDIASSIKEERQPEMDKYLEDVKVYKRELNKRKRSATEASNANKRGRTARSTTAARSAPPLALTPAVAAPAPAGVDFATLFNEPEILGADAQLQSSVDAAANFAHSYPEFNSGALIGMSATMSSAHAPIALPAALQAPLQTSVPGSYPHYLPQGQYLPQYPLHSNPQHNVLPASVTLSSDSTWNTLTTTLDMLAPAISHSENANSVELSALEGSGVQTMPPPAIGHDFHVSQPSFVDGTMLAAVPSTFATIDGFTIPADLAGLNSAINELPLLEPSTSVEKSDCHGPRSQ